MRCQCYYIVGLTLVSVVIVQVLCNDETPETHSREKRQDYGAWRQPPHRPPPGDTGPNNGVYRGPEGPANTRYAQPLSLSQNGGYNGVNNVPNIGGRFGETQDQGLGWNNALGMGTGGGAGAAAQSAQNAASLSFQAAQNAATFGNSGGTYGGIPNMGGFGGAQDASRFGFQAAQNAANVGRGGSLFSNTPATNTGLLGLGGQQNAGLLNLGGQPNGALINIGGPGLISIGGQGQPQNNNRPQGPDNNSPGHQGGNKPPGQQPGGPGGPGGRPGPSSGPGHPNGRPTNEDSFQKGQPGGFVEGQPGGRPSDPNYDQNWPNGQNSGQSGKPGGGSNQGSGSGNKGHPSNSQNQGSGGGGGGGGGSHKCRGNQYTCQNRECVPRNARCNGVNECQDGSDELNCYTSGNNPEGQGSSSVDHATTAAPLSGHTDSSSSSGCVLPEQPTGGSFVLGSCQNSCNVAAGTRVPITSFLTYKCNQGYTLNGNNVTFCHDGAWYMPPTCVKTCSPLKSNSVDIECKLDGRVVSCESTIAPGTKATLACKHSFKIPITDDPGYRELTCLEEGIWDRTLYRCLPECGTAVSHGNTLIVNGFTAKLGVFPWHVGIYEKNAAEAYEQICAGTLISPDLVVSAAHCFYDDTINEVMDASKYAVAAGKHYRLYNMPEKYAQTSRVKTIEVATRYYGASGNFAEDISLVRLESPFTLTTLVRPVCMDWENAHEREQLQSGQSGKAVGWGKTSQGVPSTELQEINLPYIPYQQCVSAVPEEFKGYVTADKFCAGYLNGSSLCEGDSGGGLCFELNGLWYLRGIVSVSPVHENTCDNNYYTAFTNVGRFREWVRAAYVSTS